LVPVAHWYLPNSAGLIIPRGVETAGKQAGIKSENKGAVKKRMPKRLPNGKKRCTQKRCLLGCK